MTFLKGEMALRVQQATGREAPPEKSVHGLDEMPINVLQDIEAINQSCGSLAVFAYLYHVTDASFTEVKQYVGDRGWSQFEYD
jgi:hypothetical protein